MRGFYGTDAQKNYFEGFYFKQVSGLDTVAVIPALHAEGDGRRFASVQVITDALSGFARIPIEQFEANEKRFAFRVGKCAFSETGIELNLRTHALEASGRLVFGPLTRLKSPIMGPFEHIPFMQCRHRVVSMAHSVYGTLTVNGRRYTFDSAPGYIEGDRGSSFPARYLWTHHASEKDALSLMLSVADIPFGLIPFTGVLCPILWEGKEYRLATYRGARLTVMGSNAVCVKQGAFSFTAELLSENARLLRAPIRGKMERHIRESPSCKVRYTFKKGGATLFDITAPNASFECEYPAFQLR
ncbi:MAG: tocopherol cyclase family protein [Clostridiaceae bacterium]|nr:hypothetical protein [Eubacteriales bacterium]